MKPGDLRARDDLTTGGRESAIAIVLFDCGQGVSVLQQRVRRPSHALGPDGAFRQITPGLPLALSLGSVPRYLFCKEKHAIWTWSDDC